jgi:hypothetical protein
MLGINFRLPTQRTKGGSRLAGSAAKSTGSASDGAASKATGSAAKGAASPPGTSGQKELPPLDPSSLKRIKGRTVVLPSQMPERMEIKPDRPPITRARPDTVPPQDFAPPAEKPRKFLGIPLPFQKAGLRKQEEQRIKDGAHNKKMSLIRNGVIPYDMEHELHSKPEYMETIRERHRQYDTYSEGLKGNTQIKLANHHPGFTAALAEMRNRKTGLPNQPTATRPMTKEEQAFLTNAHRRLKEDIQAKPFHMHGETAITGNKKGEITQFNHTAGLHSHAMPGEGDKFHLHSHPPFLEPFTSSASEPDHRLAARFLEDHNLTGTYVTNGKDVLHIQPNSLELVKLTPDPKAEKKLGKFPEAYRLPDPQQPAYPFANHEAPPGAKKWVPPPKSKHAAPE